MRGNARIGSTVMGFLLEGSPRCRVLHRSAGSTVDLGAARSTLGGLAVPARGQVRLHVLLDPVDGVEDDHALPAGTTYS